ncbi:hypothetical protein K443DRAFT_677175 [Laccaria amethystina LaAM-08-1]|uniref:Uncharacterized protein n=1 Tax=Laccaria amethystina LaAM-08-1 TaxID=1095629 RepID=A0A0C9WUT8_9AGAR|nr:hypothetical protein K443DRAFT_677175 [Laccaria amethystina LaAM-08-1]
MSSRPSRYLKRDWNHKKPHLAKYSSLPTLQLTPTERPIFQCQQCGFINTLISICLWCCWTSDAAHDQFHRSAPRRPRRISAPPRVTTPNITLNSRPIPDAIGNITTSVRPSINRHHLQTTTDQSQSQIRSPTKTPRLRLSIPSLPSQSDVDRSTTTSKSSRFSLFLDFNNNAGRPDSNQHTHTHARETMKKTLDDDDDEEHTSPISGGGGGGESHQRTLRRKRRINIVEQAQLDVSSSGPIAISFDLELKEKEKEKEDESRISFDHNLESMRYPASKELPQTPPPSSSPILPPPSSSSSPPSSSSQTQTTPTSIRIGHPNRPYYTAIRKNMSPPASPSSSPPPSRPTSSMGLSPSRPTSLIGEGDSSFPPSSFHHQRPISLCLGTGTGVGMFSPFVIDNAEEGQGAINVHSPTSKPKPGAKNDGSSNKKAQEDTRGSIGFSMSGETELRMALASIQTESRSGVGGVGGGGGGVGEFRYRETSVTTTPTPTATTPSGSSSSAHDHHAGRRAWGKKRGGSISSGVVARVKAFRKSLRDLIGAGAAAF